MIYPVKLTEYFGGLFLGVGMGFFEYFGMGFGYGYGIF
jgi:hypothetical protein